MNKQILKLAEQAGFCGTGFHNTLPGVSQETALKNFAELIVRECIDIVSPYAVRMENFDGGHPIADLKKHFGVEE